MKKKQIQVQRATSADSAAMTRLITASKSYWEYPSEWMELWKDELTITQEKLDERDFYLGKDGDDLVFVYSLSQLDANRYELEECWVAPESIGRGYGQMLIDDVKERLGSLGAKQLKIISDPKAAGFYRRMGAMQVGEEPTKIAGRVFPVFELKI